MTEQFRPLADTVALVTGATSGIGEAAARALHARGARVAVVGRRHDRLDAVAASFGDEDGLSLVADLSRRQDADTVVERTVERFGRLDIVVNAAGVMLNGPTLEAQVEEWETMLAVNLGGSMFVAKAALPHLIDAATGGRGVADLVNISSIAGRFANRTVAMYNATKFGITAASEALRQEFAPHSVRVSVVEPGVVDTELFGHQQIPVQAHYDRLFSGVERLRPEDLGELIAYVVCAPRRMALAEIVVRPTDQI